MTWPGPDSDCTEQGKQKEETLRFSLTSSVNDVVELGVLCGQVVSASCFFILFCFHGFYLFHEPGSLILSLPITSTSV